MEITIHNESLLHGPISQTSLIRKVQANVYNDSSLRNNYITLNLSNGNNGTFKIEDVVYQGDNYKTANAYGVVLSWSPSTHTLELGSIQGQFHANHTIKAVSTNSSYLISSYEVDPAKLVRITTQPDPLTANPSDDFGYDTTIEEWPRIT